MRPVTLNPNNIQASFNELEAASHEGDTVEIAQNFSTTGVLTPTLILNLSAPTAANVAAVLATLLEIMQKGGINRTT
jgi:hypothetical protein